MGNGKLLIGVGLGDAGVNNPQPAIAQFANIVNQQRQQRLANQQALLEAAGKINPNGIRDQDRDVYMNKYNDWKQAAINANNLPQNSRERMSALFDAQQKYGALNAWIGQNKQDAQYEHQYANHLAMNPHLVTQDAHDKFLKSMQSSSDNPNYIAPNQYGTLDRYIDPEKLSEEKNKLNKLALEQAQWSDPIQSHGVDKLGNKTGVVVHNERQVDPQGLLEKHLHFATLNDDVKTDLQRRYGDIQGVDPQETLALRVRQDLLDRGDLKTDKNGQLVSGVKEATKPAFKANNRPDLFYEHYDYRQAHPLSSTNAPTPLQYHYVEPMRTGGEPELNKFLSLADKGQFRSSEKPAGQVVNGYHVINIPDQVEIDQKLAKANKEARDYYNQNPEKKGGVLGFGGTPIPYEQSQEYKDNPPASPYKVVKPAESITLDPNDPVDYAAKAGAIAARLKIPVSAINNMAGGKGGRGTNPAQGATQVSKQTAQSNGVVKFSTPDGKTYAIPFNKQKQFRAQFPNAKIIQ